VRPSQKAATLVLETIGRSRQAPVGTSAVPRPYGFSVNSTYARPASFRTVIVTLNGNPWELVT
jgi:hypothetical protein